MTDLKIEMVHDPVCSWCPIGYNHLTQALENLNASAQWRFLPFELNPNMPIEGEDIGEHLQRRYGWNEQRHDQYRADLIERARAAGVNMDFTKRTRYFNTHLAHRLMLVAERESLHHQARAQLIDAYFKHGRNLGELNVLLDVGEAIGLDRQEVQTALTSLAITKAFEQRSHRVEQLGISTTPTFIFNHRHVHSGSHSVQYFESLIEALYQTDNSA